MKITITITTITITIAISIAIATTRATVIIAAILAPVIPGPLSITKRKSWPD